MDKGEAAIRWICGRYRLVGADIRQGDYVNTEPTVDEIVAVYKAERVSETVLEGLRDVLKMEGIEVEHLPEGVRWRYITEDED